MGSTVLLRSKATSRQRKSSSPIRSASSTSTSPKCRPPRESSTSSWRSTELRSSPSSNLPKKPIVLPHRPSWSPWSKPFPTKSIRCSPIMASSSRLPPRQANAPNARYMTHMFALRCREHGIEHRFTKINHPWTNGQVERMNRTIKDATVKRYHYDDHDQLRRHLADFVAAYNFARRLKTLKGLTPFEFVSKCWTSEPDRFKLNPLHQMPGLNTLQSPREGCVSGRAPTPWGHLLPGTRRTRRIQNLSSQARPGAQPSITQVGIRDHRKSPTLSARSWTAGAEAMPSDHKTARAISLRLTFVVARY